VGVAVGMLLSMRTKDSTDSAERRSQRPTDMERAR